MKNNIFSFVDKAISAGKRDVQCILDRQRKEEEAQTLEGFDEQKQDLDDLVNSEISELVIIGDNCEGDIQKTSMLKPWLFSGLS